MALVVGRSPIPVVGKGAVRDIVLSCYLPDGEFGVSIQFGARCNECSKS